MLGLFRRENHARSAAINLYRAITARARLPIFHFGFAVPDNVDGRFDLFALHAFLVLERLNEAKMDGAVGRYLADEIFDGFQQGLREMGVTDAGLSRRIKTIADAFYGRISAYSAAKTDNAIADALLRNVYRGAPRIVEVRALANRIQGVRVRLAGQNLSAGEIDFGPAPENPEHVS